MGHVTFLARKPPELRDVKHFFGQDCLVEKLAASGETIARLQAENEQLRAENQRLRETAATWRAAAKHATAGQMSLSIRLAAAEGCEARRSHA